MYLEMHIGERLIDRVPVDFTGIETIGQRENYLADLVNTMERLHKQKIIAMRQLPVFFIEGVQSKMNGDLTRKPPHPANKSIRT